MVDQLIRYSRTRQACFEECLDKMRGELIVMKRSLNDRTSTTRVYMRCYPSGSTQPSLRNQIVSHVVSQAGSQPRSTFGRPLQTQLDLFGRFRQRLRNKAEAPSGLALVRLLEAAELRWKTLHLPYSSSLATRALLAPPRRRI